eukprot:15346790-Ditylum_brightwellii.AAC.2
MERSKQNNCVDGDKDDGVNSRKDSDDSAYGSVDGGDKHLTHLSQVRSKQIKCVDDDNGDGVDNIDDGGDKNLTHISQTVDCCLMERSNQDKCVGDDNVDEVDYSVDD